MIEGILENGEPVRTEAYRVVLPGFEWLESYVTPRVTKNKRTGEVTIYDSEWVVLDKNSMSMMSSGAFPTEEEAIASALANCRKYRLTPEMHERIVARKRELRENFLCSK